MRKYDELAQFCKDPLGAEEAGSRYASYADYALGELSSWFGPPTDADRQFDVVVYHRSVMSYDYLRRRYALFIRKDEPAEQMLGSVAHEMYHRVTWTRKRGGLHKAVWVDEVLACSASRKLLLGTGYREYVDALVAAAAAAPVRLTMRQLAHVKHFPVFAVLRPYPRYFSETVIDVGESLEAAVGWPNICAMIHCKTWPDWLSLLSTIERKRIAAMFGDFPPLARQ